jgi:SpoIID/LytB domain
MKGNKHNIRAFFTHQLDTWDEIRQRYEALKYVGLKQLGHRQLQYNPARMVSTGAQIDRQTIAQRACFLCEKNRPEEQLTIDLGDDFELMVNPFPVLPMHFTIVRKTHVPQTILENYTEIHRLLELFPELFVFYNGPMSGASAPDHMHFQAGIGQELPLMTVLRKLEKEQQVLIKQGNGSSLSMFNSVSFNAFVIKSKAQETEMALFKQLYAAMPVREGEKEPRMNIVAWRDGSENVIVVLPRDNHRPACYFEEEDRRMVISPGALDMAGLIITPREEDFNRMSEDKLISILKEVSIKEKDMKNIKEKLITVNNSQQLSEQNGEPRVSVGIVTANEIVFSLHQPYNANGTTVSGKQSVSYENGAIIWNGKRYKELVFQPQEAGASFSLEDVTIGVNFHWERKETQTFLGILRFAIEGTAMWAINELPVERYLESVISSEMSATSSLRLLEAHAVISRSWLLAQIENRRSAKTEQTSLYSCITGKDKMIKWYDRQDHTLFDVCADDHCQRYQGITKETSPHVAVAIQHTRGQVLMSEGKICDARFSKCCGGAMEEFQYCWEDSPKPYLKAIGDTPEKTIPDLTVEANAEEWIRTSPDSFCNTTDKNILSQVLNDYDQETTDFYRWRVDYTQEEISQLINSKLNIDFGQIMDLIPIERGKSARLCQLKIVGTKQTLTIGKELEIRRALSPSHLYSSAFVVDKEDVNAEGIPALFHIIGCGWGHGVGLCQIGAAVMGEKGYNYDQILAHYYPGADLKELY